MPVVAEHPRDNPGRAGARHSPAARRARAAPALSRIAGVDVIDLTESSLLHIIFVAGLHAIHEKAEEDAYALAAAGRVASGEADELRRIARRRRPGWSDEP